MLRKLLITSLLFIALFTVSCNMFKKTSDEVTGSITGVDSSYLGTWDADSTGNTTHQNLLGAYIIVKDDSSIDFYFRPDQKTYSFPSTSILKFGNTSMATYNETDPNNNNVVLKKHILTMTFEERDNGNGTFSSVMNVSYSVEENNSGTIVKGVFVRRA
ncbi:hypothetical protein [Brachyspira intermedia]|uniref:hypothetical protein n=1 Tax=Brachyspira intermedia TaxID=84377 RepID=UPI00262FF598|nr:hypothetical protein [uncultured Brachyspira sp.]